MLTLHKARNILKKWLEEIITNIVRHVIALNTSKFVMIDPYINQNTDDYR
jgi:hypothetical protein